MKAIITDPFILHLGISVVTGAIVFGLIQKFKELSFINKPLYLWILNLLFSAVAFPFSKYYYKISNAAAIWVCVYTFIGANVIYQILKKQDFIKYTPKTLKDNEEELDKPKQPKIIPRQMPLSEDKYSLKSPYTMEAENITIHNTANKASANNEISYMIGNDSEVSYHYAIDNKEVVQAIPESRNAWHAGDGGKGPGNRKSIGVEICYSTGELDLFKQSEDLTAKFVAQLLNEKGWGLDKVKKHKDWNGKNCPRKTMELGWDRFIDMIDKYM